MVPRHSKYWAVVYPLGRKREGGGTLNVVHGRGRMAIDLCIPATVGAGGSTRRTSLFYGGPYSS